MSANSVSAAFAAALTAGEKAVLATLVRTTGSTYRKVGASMLIRQSGETVGILSGGCLERDIAKAALLLHEDRKLLHFDLTPEDDYLLGYGKGCAGQLWVLLEPIRAGLMQKQLEPEHTTANAIIIDSGKRIIISSNGTIVSDLDDDQNDLAVISKKLSNKGSNLKSFFDESLTTEGKRITWCGWYSRPAIDLLIFGAGVDAIPVYELASSLNWEIRICDHRVGMLKHETFPRAKQLIPIQYDNIPNLRVGPSTHVVIMSHNLLIDTRALAWAIEQPEIPYIGLLGPTQRRERILEFLKSENLNFISRLSGRLRSPVGLDLGGSSETDIALAIISQIQREWHNASGCDLAQAVHP